MRIAALCADLGIRVPGHKGASVHLCSLTEAFARAGHDVLLIGVAGHGPPPVAVDSRLFTHPGRREGVAREVQKLAFNELVAESIEPVLEAFAPHVLYERLALFADCGTRLAERLSLPHVVEVNALLAREEADWRGLHLAGLARHREQTVLSRCNLAVAVSDEVAAAVRAATASANVAVVPNGVDGELFSSTVDRPAARRRWGVAPEARVVGFVGALRPWHGLDVAVRALARLPRDVVLAVAGEGPIRCELEALANGIGLGDRVRWYGHLAHADIPSFLGALDVAIAPYPPLDHFGFSPLKLYEYLASGTPVVASDIGQVRAALSDGQWGRLVAPGNSERLAEALAELLAEPVPAQAIARRARRETLMRHSWASRVDQITALIGQLRGERDHALA